MAAKVECAWKNRVPMKCRVLGGLRNVLQHW